MLNYQTDWEILALRKQYRQYRQYSQDYDLSKPVWIGDTCYQFQLLSLFDDRLKVYLPAQFEELPEPIARVKYPSGNRPPIIKTNGALNVDFTFSLLSKAAAPLTVQSVWQEIDRHFPRNVLYETGAFKSEKIETIWLEYKNFSLETEVYNILFIVQCADGAVMLGRALFNI